MNRVTHNRTILKDCKPVRNGFAVRNSATLRFLAGRAGSIELYQMAVYRKACFAAELGEGIAEMAIVKVLHKAAVITD